MGCRTGGCCLPTDRSRRACTPGWTSSSITTTPGLHQIDETIDAGAHTAAEAARRLLWTRRGNLFTELDLLGRCLAVTETMAHLDVLVHAGRLSRTEVDGIAYYTRG